MTKTCNFLASSIGIIGGADGPTAIFVASAPLEWYHYLAAALVVLAVALVIRRLLKKK